MQKKFVILQMIFCLAFFNLNASSQTYEDDTLAIEESLINSDLDTISNKKDNITINKESTGAIYIDLKYKYCEIFINNVSYGRKSILVDNLKEGQYAVVIKRKSVIICTEVVNVINHRRDKIVVFIDNPCMNGAGLLAGGVGAGIGGVISLIYYLSDAADDPYGKALSVFFPPAFFCASAFLCTFGGIKLHKYRDWERENLISVIPAYDLSNNNYGISFNMRF